MLQRFSGRRLTVMKSAGQSDHPRLRHYPHHADYLGLEPEFRPFMMFTDRSYYRAPAVNTDKFGLREQYDARDQFLDLESLGSTHHRCNVLLGGSTVFGVDATSDRTTISHLLNLDDTPCLNLGVRGATGQQELILFLLLKQYFPRIVNVVLFTGLNNCALAARPGTRVYPGFGGIFYEGMRPDPARQQELVGPGRFRLTQIVDGAYSRSRLFRGALNLVLSQGGRPPQLSSRLASFGEKLGEIMRFVRNDLATWGQLQASGGYKIHFVLQPAIGWTSRRTTAIETECFEADLRLFPETRLFADRQVYQQYRAELAGACGSNGIDFHDANEWFEDPRFSRSELFTDVCHLTDEGNRIVADLLRERLSWAGP